MAKKQSKSGGNRKHGRNSDYCKVYTAAGLQEKNHKRRLRRHLTRYPHDVQAIERYEKSYGFHTEIKIVCNGVVQGRSMTQRAIRKNGRGLDKGLAIHLRAQRDARRHSRRVMAEKMAEQAKQQNKQTVVTVV